MLTRRELLKSSLIWSLAPCVPSFVARTAWAAGAQRERRMLVVIQLDGGNDGLNTVVPFRDENYARLRPKLRIADDRLVKISDDLALHTALKPVTRLLDDGRLTIVQGVGYPNPNRSHFESMAIWHSARIDAADHGQFGWLGRGLDVDASAANSPQAVFSGPGAVPVALWGRRCTCASVKSLDELALDAPADLLQFAASAPQAASSMEQSVSNASRDAFSTAQRLSALMDRGARGDSDSRLTGHLKTIAAMIKAGSAARVFYALQSGYDTHAGQANAHYQLLAELARAINTFTDDMTAAGLGEQVLVLVFSEFGRRAAENASEGTDHGAAAPILLAGPKLASPILGPRPNLVDLDQGDVKMAIDFRQVYATILDQWLDVRPSAVLPAEYEQLKLFSV